ncbi:hypothetical protein Ep4_020 [Pseudomonas phage Ep4]|uniref:Uncharacterized protein n=1 Tax=Pseudomonas phage Ep4 TaxID=3057492 RepID=A0AAU9EVJ5_9CAUD|nr:hypothetical protein Ep4_020 [Pseudomonas phage Ep4]
MTVLEFLADYAELYLARASKEGIKATVLYTENPCVDDNGKAQVVSSVVITAPNGGAIDISVGFPLTMQMNHAYRPELTADQWLLFLKAAKPHRFPSVAETMQ